MITVKELIYLVTWFNVAILSIALMFHAATDGTAWYGWLVAAGSLVTLLFMIIMIAIISLLK